MAFSIDENGDITLIQGDSGNLTVSGINTDKDYTVFFAVQDASRNPVGTELSVNSMQRDSVVFVLTGDYTDLLTVGKNEEYAIYYYGIKICYSDDDFEDTLVLSGGDIGTLNTITVYPKKVEGI